jgi:polygalacturonase
MTGLRAGLAGVVVLMSAALPAMVSAASAAGLGPALATGDPRVVTRPVIPPVCARLVAQMSATGRQFSPADEASPPDTARIQSALDGCSVSAGQGQLAVELMPRDPDSAFLSGPLRLPGHVVLLVDAGVTLYASRNPANYQASGSVPSCGTLATKDNGCVPFIDVVGADAGIMGIRRPWGDGVIDGRGDLDMLGQTLSWWELAQQAKAENLKQNNPRLIEAYRVDDLTVYDIDLENAPFFHLYYEGGTGLTVWGLQVKTPATARNTDGIDIDSATDVTVRDSYLQDGDDGVAIKTNSGHASNITIEDDHFYGTHGMSIGSQTQYGVTNVLFRDNTVSGVDSAGNVSTDNNGLRIKTSSSDGGAVSLVTYEDTCMSGVQHPIVITPFYSAGNGSTTPLFTGIVVDGAVSVRSQPEAGSVLDGYTAAYPLQLTLEYVHLDATAATAQDAQVRIHFSNLVPSGPDVTVTAVAGRGHFPICRFPAFPRG